MTGSNRAMELRASTYPLGSLAQRLDTYSKELFNRYTCTRKSPKVWFGQLSANVIWKITEDIWQSRNEAEHKDEKSRISNIKCDTEANTAIKDIYDRLPKNLQIIPHDDPQFFAKNVT